MVIYVGNDDGLVFSSYNATEEDIIEYLKMGAWVEVYNPIPFKKVTVDIDSFCGYIE